MATTLSNIPGTASIVQPDPFPTSNTPAIYADGIANISNNNFVVKMIFTRLDLDANASNTYKSLISGQIIMPIDGFINMHLFLLDAIGYLRANGYVTDKMIADIASSRKTL